MNCGNFRLPLAAGSSAPTRFSYSPEIVELREKFYKDCLGPDFRYERTETSTVSQSNRLTGSSVAKKAFVDLGLISLSLGPATIVSQFTSSYTAPLLIFSVNYIITAFYPHSRIMSPPVLLSSRHADLSFPMKSNTITKKFAAWPFWKKLAVIGVVLIIVIPLSVGLGVGLSRGGSDDDDGGSSGDSNEDTPGNTPNRTSLWQPEVGASWQIILLKPLDISDGDKLTPDVDIFDLDLYDNDASTFATLKKLGKKVICYFSAGSWEDWRDDKDDFDEADLGKELDGWPDERWLNLSSPNVHSIMKKRIEMAAKKGCDAIDPDNVDGFVS